MSEFEIRNITNKFLGVVEKHYEMGGVDLIGIPTGFSILDTMIGGMRPDCVYVVGGTTSTGKTAWACDVMLNVAKTVPNKTAMYFSLEVSGEMMVNRLLSQMTDIPSGRIHRGRIDSEEWARVKLAAEELSELNIHIIDHTNTSESVMEYAFEFGEGNDISLLVVDYLSLLKDKKGESETVRIGNISRNLRNMVRPDALNVPMVLLAQLNRSANTAEDGRPRMHHLKDSSNIEQDAEAVILLHRPHKQAMSRGAEPQEIETDAEMLVEKNRSGPIYPTRAEFIPRLMRWRQ